MKKVSLLKLAKIMLTEPHKVAPIIEKNNEILQYKLFGTNYFVIARSKVIKYIFSDNANNYIRAYSSLGGLGDLRKRT